MSARVDRATLTLWNPTGSEERPLLWGRAELSCAEPISRKLNSSLFRVASEKERIELTSTHQPQRRKWPLTANLCLSGAPLEWAPH